MHFQLTLILGASTHTHTHTHTHAHTLTQLCDVVLGDVPGEGERAGVDGSVESAVVQAEAVQLTQLSRGFPCSLDHTAV